jgi:hypothetical protein
MIISRMPSSISEKAHSNCDPNAMGVKMRSRMRRISMIISNIEFRISDFGKGLISDLRFNYGL